MRHPCFPTMCMYLHTMYVHLVDPAHHITSRRRRATARHGTAPCFTQPTAPPHLTSSHHHPSATPPPCISPPCTPWRHPPISISHLVFATHASPRLAPARVPWSLAPPNTRFTCVAHPLQNVACLRPLGGHDSRASEYVHTYALKPAAAGWICTFAKARGDRLCWTDF